MSAPELTDGVVVLRMMAMADAEAHFANEDDETVRFFGGRSTIDTAREAIENSRLSWETGEEWRNYGICEAVTGKLVGFVDAHLVAPGYLPGVANISYNVHSAVRGRGYVPRAVRLMVRFLAERTDAKIAVIQFDPENGSSERVAQKAGFKRLGERTGSDGKRMIVYGVRLKPAEHELAIPDVCAS
jgi:RimJ/RimL family protein N-acetyltransferase